MRISIQFTPEKKIDFDFGYHTPLFSGMHWFTIVICDLGENNSVEYATLWLTWFKHPKYWFNYWGGKTLPKMDVLGDEDEPYYCPDCGQLDRDGQHVFRCPYREYQRLEIAFFHIYYSINQQL